MWSDKLIRILHVLTLINYTGAAITGWTTPVVATGNGNGNIFVSEDQSTYFIFTTIRAVSDANLVQYVYTVQESPFLVLTGGEVQITSSLDYETTSTYPIEVEAIDDEPSTGTITVTFVITDVNEASPAFGQTSYTACIADGATADTTVITTQATDQDTSNTVNYAITGGDTNGDFKIDANTGVMQVNSAAVDASATSSYDLVVEANDDGSPMLTGTTTVSVTVGAAINSWNTPLVGVGSGNGVISVSKDQSTYTIFTTITAVSSANLVKYVYIVQRSPFLVLNGGEVLITSPLDYETTSSYTIEVEAIDDDPATGTVTVTFSITDVNEATPAFGQTSYSVCIADGATTDTTVVTTLATDQDTSNTVNFAITGGNTNNDFKIDANTGVIQVNSVAIDASVTSSYDLVVEANDDGSPMLTGTTTVSVTVGECSSAKMAAVSAITILVLLIINLF